MQFYSDLIVCAKEWQMFEALKDRPALVPAMRGLKRGEFEQPVESFGLSVRPSLFYCSFHFQLIRRAIAQHRIAGQAHTHKAAGQQKTCRLSQFGV